MDMNLIHLFLIFQIIIIINKIDRLNSSIVTLKQMNEKNNYVHTNHLYILGLYYFLWKQNFKNIPVNKNRKDIILSN